ncbi:MAG: succinate dehydrogenase/fumarate reductase iron-sulfur subunit [Candidatus Marinimicrobia bacterium]|nr:succinate dehydrogenase/fumarate reductase iron-sulfur subunit [Candidatus Neomarinimicrobiota bacterium]
MENIEITLRIWRQNSYEENGKLVDYKLSNLNSHMSFLEMLDVLNEELINNNDDPVAFEHDCREGICGSCSMMINGEPHGPLKGTTVCQLHMFHFKNGDILTVEPWRANAFPIIKDLVVDRSSFDRIIQSGGYISVNTGSALDGNTIPISRSKAADAFDSAACIGCGACVAVCKNSSASLFVSAKISQLSILPQGEPEKKERVINMVNKMDDEGFGHCSNTGACEAQCPKDISIKNITRMNNEYIKAKLKS